MLHESDEMIDVNYPQQKQPPLIVVVHFPNDIRWKPNWMPGGDESWEAVAIYDAGGAEIFSLERFIYHMGVSENSGTPKTPQVLIIFSRKTHGCWVPHGTTILGKPHIYICHHMSKYPYVLYIAFSILRLICSWAPWNHSNWYHSCILNPR